MITLQLAISAVGPDRGRRLPIVIGILVGSIAFLSAVVGLVLGGHQLWRMYRARVPAKLSWKKIESGILELISQMRSQNFLPDVVLAIGRSGAILGGIIAGNMKNLPLALLDRQFVWDKNRREYVQSEFTDVHIGPECRKVLVVVGEVYSGQTLVECLKRLESALEGKDVKSCTLVKSKSAPCQCDYYAYEVDRPVRPAWVITDDYVRFESPSRAI